MRSVTHTNARTHNLADRRRYILLSAFPGIVSISRCQAANIPLLSHRYHFDSTAAAMMVPSGAACS